MINDTEQFSPHGTDLFGNQIEKALGGGTIAGRFLTPPFTVLSAREGGWQERKAAWIGLGIRSEVGRGSNALNLSEGCEEYRRGESDYAKTYNSGSPGRAYAHTGRRPHSGSLDERAGREPGTPYVGGDALVASENGSGTSIFDPVLTELCYRWFSPADGMILDPFAGGSVRGIVAGLLGRSYYGVELRPEQVDANREQAGTICPDAPVAWVCGDSIDELDAAPEADFIFSCPPYGDLERYSDDARDLSTMEFHTFAAQYKRIILKAVKRLKQNRFACFVVGNYRDKRTGNYRDLVGETIRGFEDAGCGYYNEAILVTAVGSLPIRVGKQFSASRKLGKTHQNILVFVKGDGKKSAAACAQI